MVLPLGQLPIESKQADRTIRKVAEAASGAVCAGSNPAGGATRRLLTRLVGSGSTVLFSSHVMELVEPRAHDEEVLSWLGSSSS